MLLLLFFSCLILVRLELNVENWLEDRIKHTQPQTRYTTSNTEKKDRIENEESLSNKLN